jgi:hypothetical protein
MVDNLEVSSGLATIEVLRCRWAGAPSPFQLGHYRLSR